MKNILKSLVLVTALIVTACKENAIGLSNIELNTKADSTSYAVGVNMASGLIDAKDDINVEVLISALRDKLAEKDLKISQEMCNEITNTFKVDLASKAGIRNLEKGRKYLADNASKEGVITTESGLQYQIIRAGAGGSKPKATDNVTVHYKGTTIEGVQFDSSYDRGQPATFPLNRVISGWTEGVQLMTVGSKFKFFIPANMAYGPRGAGDKIGPNSTLIFEVELQKIGN